MNRGPRLGLVANEYSQQIGGMSTVARATAEYLYARGYDLHLFTNQQCKPDPIIPTYPILTTDLARDLPRLSGFKMDLWHSLNYGYAPLSLRCRPLVLTVHGNDFLSPWVRFKFEKTPLLWRMARRERGRGWTQRLVDWVSLPRVDEVIAVSRFTGDLFQRTCRVKQIPMVVPNGVEQFFLQDWPPAGNAIARHPRRLMSVAALYGWQRKNIDGVIRAMALVGDRLDLEYCIVGDGTGRSSLEALAADLCVSHRVRFLGRLSQEELRAAYESASLFVLAPRPTPGDVEGFGLVYLEAAASGTPSLGTRYGGTTDAIAEGESGFFAEDASPEAIAHALEKFFTGQIRFDPDVVRAHAGRHAWPVVLRRVESIYARVCPQVREWLNSQETSSGDQVRPSPVVEAEPEPVSAVCG